MSVNRLGHYDVRALIGDGGRVWGLDRLGKRVTRQAVVDHERASEVSHESKQSGGEPGGDDW